MEGLRSGRGRGPLLLHHTLAAGSPSGATRGARATRVARSRFACSWLAARCTSIKYLNLMCWSFGKGSFYKCACAVYIKGWVGVGSPPQTLTKGIGV